MALKRCEVRKSVERYKANPSDENYRAVEQHFLEGMKSNMAAFPARWHDDIMQMQRMELLRSLNKFEPSRGFEFSTYFVNNAKMACLKYKRVSDMIRVPEHKKLKGERQIHTMSTDAMDESVRIRYGNRAHSNLEFETAMDEFTEPVHQPELRELKYEEEELVAIGDIDNRLRAGVSIEHIAREYKVLVRIVRAYAESVGIECVSSKQKAWRKKNELRKANEQSSSGD